METGAVDSAKKADEIVEAIKNFTCRWGDCYMGGLGKGGKTYPDGNHKAIEEWFQMVEEIGAAYQQGKILPEAWKNLSQVFKETGSVLNKAKGATETIAYVRNALRRGETIVGIEARVVGDIKVGVAREYDVVVKTADGKTEYIEIKAWNPEVRGVLNTDNLANMLFFSLRGKTGKKLSDIEYKQLQDAGLSPEEIQDIINSKGQLFEDLGQAVLKSYDSSLGIINPNLLNEIDRFWVFDARVTPSMKTEIVERFSELVASNGPLTDLLSQAARLPPGKSLSEDDVIGVMKAMIRINTGVN